MSRKPRNIGWRVASARAPSPPHLAVGGFDSARIARWISQLRPRNTFAKARAGSSQGIEITCFGYGKLDVAFGIRSDKLRQTQRGQTRRCEPRGYRPTGPGYHGNTHPQRVKRRHPTAVREWIKRNVNVLIGCKVACPLASTDEFQSILSDTLLLKNALHPVQLTRIKKSLIPFEQQPRLGESAQNGSPGPQYRILDFY